MSAQTFTAMGTTVSIRIAAGGGHEPIEAFMSARQAFEEIEAIFSLFRPETELSRIARGELRIEDASEQVIAASEAARAWEALTHGAFTAHRPDGVLDLSGIVKAQAILAAAGGLAGAGVGAFALNAGGDILTAGVPARGYWAAGIVDPQDRSRLLTTVRLDQDLPALATSGSGERGEHIWRDHGAEGEIVQASVIAADIVTADVLATAIVAGGSATLDQVTADFPIGVLVVFSDGSLAADPTLRGRLA